MRLEWIWILMATFNWASFLRQWNDAILDDPDAIESGWIGHPPASAEQIQAVESRIGTHLLSSYTSLPKASRGGARIRPIWVCIQDANWLASAGGYA
jgi:hypothetical protein